MSQIIYKSIMGKLVNHYNKLPSDQSMSQYIDHYHQAHHLAYNY
jgi:hypothetical protein